MWRVPATKLSLVSNCSGTKTSWSQNCCARNSCFASRLPTSRRRIFQFIFNRGLINRRKNLKKGNFWKMCPKICAFMKIASRNRWFILSPWKRHNSQASDVWKWGWIWLLKEYTADTYVTKRTSRTMSRTGPSGISIRQALCCGRIDNICTHYLLKSISALFSENYVSVNITVVSLLEQLFQWEPNRWGIRSDWGDSRDNVVKELSNLSLCYL